MKKQYDEGRVNQIVEQLKEMGHYEKYNHPGIYTISIEDQLVYVGKSMDMAKRVAEHIVETENPTNHKYKILRQAKDEGHSINFDVSYVATETEEEKIYDEIGEEEGNQIRKHFPPLNYQVPKKGNYHSYFVNKKAKVITLEEILNKDITKYYYF